MDSVYMISTMYVNRLTNDKNTQNNFILSLTSLLEKSINVNYEGCCDRLDSDILKQLEFENNTISDYMYEYISHLMNEMQKDIEVVPFKINTREKNFIMTVMMLCSPQSNFSIEKANANTLPYTVSTSAPIKIRSALDMLNSTDDEEISIDEDEIMGVHKKVNVIIFHDSETDDSDEISDEITNTMFKFE